MPVEQNNPQEIGIVTGITGDAYAQTDSGTRALEPGSPIYQGEELITGNNSNVEVRFVDDTLISQGENSRIALDDYVYDPDGGESSFLSEIAEGTFRTVTGKIAEQNPDRFKLGSPLATIGIRGTIILSEVTGSGEKHGVEEIHAGKALILQSKSTGELRQLFSGQMVDVSGSGLLSPVRPLSTQERDKFREISPANIRQEEDLREQEKDEQQQDDEQNGEKGQQDEQEDGQEKLPGDVTPGGGDIQNPDGILPGGEVDGGQQDQLLTPREQKLIQEKNQEQQKQPHQEPPIKIGQHTKPEPPQEPDEITELLGNDPETTGSDSDFEDPNKTPPVSHDIHGSGSFNGTNEADTLTGSSSKDFIKGLGGNDTIYGEAGDDKLFGGIGNDSIYGGAGEDILNGGMGSNYLDGGTGASNEINFASYDGQANGVIVDLNNINDDGNVIVTHGEDQDILTNIEGVIGTAHKDTLTGDDSVNSFAPGLNSQYVSGDTSTYDVVNGGNEFDWVQFENLDSQYSVEVCLTGVNGDGYIFDNTKSSDEKLVSQISLIDIENISGSSGNDTLTGNSGKNTIKGGAGNDIIDGKGGDDSLLGGEGNDSIIGGYGFDSIDGGEGTDILSYSYLGSCPDFGMIFNMTAAGTGTAKFEESPTIIEDTFTNIEKILGSNADDVFSGSEYADTFEGNDGADNINGLGGNDVLYGGEGDDTIYGGAGDDIINGGLGHNYLYGGTDADTAMGKDTLSYAGADNVSIDMQLGKAYHDSTYDNFYHFTTFIGSDGEDSFTGFGTAADIFFGGKGADTFTGKDGSDTFDGGEGVDTMSFAGLSGTTGVIVDASRTGYGTATHLNSTTSTIDINKFTNVEVFIGTDYTDTFNGCSNDETFIGGRGADIFNGGDGHDTLDYSDHETSVTITLAANGSGIATRNYVDGSPEKDTFNDIDNFFGSMADDTFISGSSNINHTFDGNGGTDFISFAGPGISEGVTINLADNASGTTCTSSGGSEDSFTNIEGVVGSQYADTITASTVGASTIKGGEGADTIKLGLNDGLSTTIIYNSLSEGGDTIQKFQTTDPTAANNDKLYFKGSDFDSDSTNFFFEINTASSSYDTETSGLEYDGNPYNDACFVFDTDSNSLYYDNNGANAGGETLIATFDTNPDLGTCNIDVA